MSRGKKEGVREMKYETKNEKETPRLRIHISLNGRTTQFLHLLAYYAIWLHSI